MQSGYGSPTFIAAFASQIDDGSGLSKSFLIREESNVAGSVVKKMANRGRDCSLFLPASQQSAHHYGYANRNEQDKQDANSKPQHIGDKSHTKRSYIAMKAVGVRDTVDGSVFIVAYVFQSKVRHPSSA